VKPNKENIINDILIELEKGITFEDCFKLIQTKSNLVRSTFSSYWKIANERYKDIVNKRQSELNALSTDLEKERLKSAILTKHERILMAQGIAQGKAWKSGNVMVVPNAGDRIRALDFIAKVEGDYTASKIQTEITQTTKIDLTALSDDELRILAEMQRKSGISQT
jgi:hypothetical protein